MKPVRVNDRLTERDRAQWAGLYRLLAKAVTVGAGEYLMTEPLMFGRAFSKKPHLTWSASGSGITFGENIRSGAWPHPDLSEVKAQKHAPKRDWLRDGGFDFQGYQNLQGFMTDGIPKWDSDMSAFGDPNHEWAQYWFQEPASTEWVLTQERVNPDVGIPYPGTVSKWSAKLVSDGSPGPWLTYYNFDYGRPYKDQGIRVTEETDWIWMSYYGPYVDVVPFARTQYVYIDHAPAMTHFYIGYWSYSERPFQMRTRVYQWPEFLIEQYWPNDIPEQQFRVGVDYGYVKQEDVFTHPGGGWRKHEFRMPTLPRLVHRDDPIAEIEGGRWLATMLWRVEGAQPGQVIYLDDCYQSPDLRSNLVPSITVGIAEWVRDAANMYTGARLWFKVGSPAPEWPVGPMKTFQATPPEVGST